MNITESVLEGVRQHPGCLGPDLAERIGIHKRSVLPALCKLVESGDVVRTGPAGSYRYQPAVHDDARAELQQVTQERDTAYAQLAKAEQAATEETETAHRLRVVLGKIGNVLGDPERPNGWSDLPGLVESAIRTRDGAFELLRKALVEIADALGVKPDNEAVLCRIEELQHQLTETERELVKWRDYPPQAHPDSHTLDVLCEALDCDRESIGKTVVQLVAKLRQAQEGEAKAWAAQSETADLGQRWLDRFERLREALGIHPEAANERGYVERVLQNARRVGTDAERMTMFGEVSSALNGWADTAGVEVPPYLDESTRALVVLGVLLERARTTEGV